MARRIGGNPARTRGELVPPLALFQAPAGDAPILRPMMTSPAAIDSALLRGAGAIFIAAAALFSAAQPTPVAAQTEGRTHEAATLQAGQVSTVFRTFQAPAAAPAPILRPLAVAGVEQPAQQPSIVFGVQPSQAVPLRSTIASDRQEPEQRTSITWWAAHPLAIQPPALRPIFGPGQPEPAQAPSAIFGPTPSQAVPLGPLRIGSVEQPEDRVSRTWRSLFEAPAQLVLRPIAAQDTQAPDGRASLIWRGVFEAQPTLIRPVIADAAPVLEQPASAVFGQQPPTAVVQTPPLRPLFAPVFEEPEPRISLLWHAVPPSVAPPAAADNSGGWPEPPKRRPTRTKTEREQTDAPVSVTVADAQPEPQAPPRALPQRAARDTALARLARLHLDITLLSPVAVLVEPTAMPAAPMPPLAAAIAAPNTINDDDIAYLAVVLLEEAHLPGHDGTQGENR